MIKAHAGFRDFGSVLDLWVGYYEIQDGHETIQTLTFGPDGTPSIQPRETLKEGIRNSHASLSVSLPIAEEIYKALDRFFGRKDETPATIRDVLAKEQQRVDKLIDHLIS
jgi:hypothetical protein